MKQNIVDVRQLSVGTLETIREENLTKFHNIVRTVFQGRFSSVTKERLLKGKKPNHMMMCEVHTECIKELETKNKSLETDIELQKEFIAKKQQECDEKLKAFQNAQIQLKKAEEKLLAAHSALKQFEEDNQKITNLLKKEQWLKKQLEKRILIHPSATLQQIKDHQDGVFIATSIDAKLLSTIGCVDCIFKSSKEESMIEILPPSITNSERDEEEINSLISYADMVIHYYLESKDFVALFSNEEIAAILRANGYEY